MQLEFLENEESFMFFICMLFKKMHFIKNYNIIEKTWEIFIYQTIRNSCRLLFVWIHIRSIFVKTDEIRRKAFKSICPKKLIILRSLLIFLCHPSWQLIEQLRTCQFFNCIRGKGNFYYFLAQGFACMHKSSTILFVWPVFF